MNEVLSTRSGRIGFVAGTAVMMLVIGAAGLGYHLGTQRTSNLNDVLLRSVSTAATGTNMAVATGQISDDSEGVFFLDFTTGDLQCLVYYPRSGAFGARYFTNVRQQLPGAGRNGNYLLVTGNAVGTRGTSNLRPANCLVYVTDVTSGSFAAYVVPWNKTAESSSQAQGGPLLFVGGGPVRNFQVPNQPAGNNAAGNGNNAAGNNGAAVNAQNNNVQNNNMQAGGAGNAAAGGGRAAAGNGNMQGNAGAGNAVGAQNNAGGINPGLGNGGLGNGGLGNGGLGNGAAAGGRAGGGNDPQGAKPRGDKKKGQAGKGNDDAD